MKKSRTFLLLLFTIFVSNLLTASGQGNPAEIKKLVQGLSRISTQNNCDGKFSITEQRRNDSGFRYTVSYILKGKAAYQQTFISDAMETMVELSPIKLNDCNALFVNYSQGASGSYQQSYLVFPSAKKFSYLTLPQSSGYFRVEDLDNDGETEIIVQESPPSSDYACEKFAYWGRIFHLNRASSKLVEMEGGDYPKYYASLAKQLRSNYENYRDDKDVSYQCKQIFVQLIKKADGFAKGGK